MRWMVAVAVVLAGCSDPVEPTVAIADNLTGLWHESRDTSFLRASIDVVHGNGIVAGCGSIAGTGADFNVDVVSVIGTADIAITFRAFWTRDPWTDQERVYSYDFVGTRDGDMLVGNVTLTRRSGIGLGVVDTFYVASPTSFTRETVHAGTSCQ